MSAQVSNHYVESRSQRQKLFAVCYTYRKIFNLSVTEVKVKVKYTWYSASSRGILATEALRYGACR